MTVTEDGTTIDSSRVRGTLVIEAAVTITRSLVEGNIDIDHPGASLTILDSEVDGGATSAPAIGFSDITMRRVEVRGARVSVLCGSNCIIEDSWLHSQHMESDSDWHVNGYLSNGGSDVVIRHNTLDCQAPDGGCTGPAAIFGDYAPLKNITFDNNLFVSGPGGHCLRLGHDPGKRFGSNPTGIVATDNVFHRGRNGTCGLWGPVTSFLETGTGNVWADNVWDDGAPIPLP
jgi:hypothetical protein